MSWTDLISITKEAREIRRIDREKPIVDCPLCGFTLVANARGVLDCPMGHWWQQGATRTPESY